MDWIKEILKRYGLTFCILCLAIWWLHSRLETIENRLAGCEDAKFRIITENNERSNKVIEQNTNAMEQNTYALERNAETIDVIISYLGNGGIIHRKKLNLVTAREGIK